jgi:tetratricopeptide (TPR) repeat protein
MFNDPTRLPQSNRLLPSLTTDPRTVEAQTGEFVPTTHGNGPTESPPSADWPSIPGYTITRLIAHGGMGRVFAGRELRLDREVAIKTLLPNADADRFLTEARITARLPHPGIPPVYALGTQDDGSPYLVMKLIQGRTLADLLKDRGTPGEGLARWLQVFEQIAQAVGFAHAQGIIHRDLKPANVMVGAFGEVQVMDWGLAKHLSGPVSVFRGSTDNSSSTIDDGHTAAGTVLGTLAYMAPEQARGEAVDARTDVFALIALLCEMLTGERPWGIGAKAEVLARAQQAALAPCYRRLDATAADAELLALAKRALAPRADERFANGQAAAEAVSRYRSGVEDRLRQAETERAAAEARALEQRKKRWALQIAGGVIAAVLTIGIISTTLGLLEARKQEQLASRRADGEKTANEQTQRGNGIILDIFEDLNIRKVKQGPDPLEAVLAKRLVRAGDQLEGTAVGDPLAMAALQGRLGHTLLTLGYPNEAVPMLQKAHAAALKLYGPNHPHTLPSMQNLAEGYREAGKLDLALPLFAETLKLMKATNAPDHINTIACMNNLALAYREAGRLDLALPLNEEVMKIKKARLGPNHPETITGVGNLAAAYRAAGKLELALPLYEEALQLSKEQLGPDHLDTLGAMSNLALGYREAGRLDLALPLNEETLRLKKAKLGPDHPVTLISMSNLASCYQDAGRGPAAVRGGVAADESAARPRASHHPLTHEQPGLGLPGCWEAGCGPAAVHGGS